MRTDDVISVFETATALADFLEISKSAVSQWGDTVPELRVFQIREKRPSIDAEIAELAGKGSRHEIRPAQGA